MAQVLAVAPIPGVKDFLTFLEFLNNKEKLSAYVAKIELTRQEINELIGKYGKAEQIDGLHAQAAAALNDAKATLEAAKVQSDELIAKATLEAAEINSEAKAVADSVAADRKDFDKYRAEQLSVLAKDKEAVNSALAVAEAREVSAQAMLSSATESKKQYDEKLLKLRALAG